ncbi:MAG: RNA polymerase sigma factor [Deltaproteobacteria bacterium]|nr:RNA polymerase sigma factor [Deltaproteobacteria bacterium]
MSSSSSPSLAPALRVVEGDVAASVEVLVAQALDGDRRAWTTLYRDNFHAVLRLVAHATGDVSVAEEITQEAFAVALVQLPRFDGRCPLGGWLRGIAMKLVYKHWRKNRRRSRAHRRLGAVPADPGVPADDQVLAHDRAEALERALEQLPLALREAFVLADIHGMSAAQAAKEFGITPGNFRVRATRARARLRQHLTDVGLIPAKDES